MKRICILLAAFISGLTASAQQKDGGAAPTSHPFILAINGGAGIPMGGFAKGDYADEKSGFAGTGAHFSITGTWFPGRHFGIGVLVDYSKFGNKGAQSLSDGYKEDSGTDSTTLYRKGSNHSLSFLAGPYYRIDLCKKSSLDVHLLGGYTHTNLAGFQIFYEDYTDNAMSQREASGGAFGMQTGIGLHYAITHKLSVQVNGDYFTSRPKLAISYDDFVVNSGRKLNSYNEPISGINATVGIAYALF